MTGIFHTLIRALADGRFYSGSELGKQLGVSRAAIWKNIQKFETLGIEVHSVRGKGYRLAKPLVLLESRQIMAVVNEMQQSRLQCLKILDTIDSTNSHAMRLLQNGDLIPVNGKYCVFLAEQQTSGKGRRGRQWISPFGQNISLTMVRQVDTEIMSAEGISLVVGLAIIRALKLLGVSGLKIKWPNDVICDEKKLAGILLEITGDIAGICQLIIGAGINVRCQPEFMAGVDQPWTDLYEVTGKGIDRNLITATVISHIMIALEEFERGGLSYFSSQWNDHDYMKDKEVEVITGGKSQFGISRGIAENGALLLETQSGMQMINGGEVSLRRVRSQ